MQSATHMQISTHKNDSSINSSQMSDESHPSFAHSPGRKRNWKSMKLPGSHRSQGALRIMDNSSRRSSRTQKVKGPERMFSFLNSYLDEEGQRKAVEFGKKIMMGYLTKMVAQKMLSQNHSKSRHPKKVRRSYARVIAQGFLAVKMAKKLLKHIQQDPNMSRYYHDLRSKARAFVLTQATGAIENFNFSKPTGSLQERAVLTTKKLLLRQLNKSVLKSQSINPQFIGQNERVSISSATSEYVNQPPFMQSSKISKSALAKEIITGNFDKEKAKYLAKNLGSKIMDKAMNTFSSHGTKI